MKRAFDDSQKEAAQQQDDDPDDRKLAGGTQAQEGEEEEAYTPEQLSRMSRSERKRHREKKRRNDVNKGFEDLMNLLLEIDPVVRAEAEDRTRRGQLKGGTGAQEENLLSRVDLINRTVEVLRRVHTENEERKLIIEHLLRSGNHLPHDVSANEAFGAGSPQLTRPISQEAAAAFGPQPAVTSSLLFPAAARPSGQLPEAGSARLGLPMPPTAATATNPSLQDVLLPPPSQNLQAQNLPAQSLPENFPGRVQGAVGGVGARGGPSGQQFSPSSLLTTNSLLQQQLLDSSFESQRNRLGSTLNAQPSALNQLLMRRQLQGTDAVASAAAAPASTVPQAPVSQSEVIEYLLRRSRQGNSGNQQQQTQTPPRNFPF